MEESAQQEENKLNAKIELIRPWQFKPGQSGNPSGKPKGTVSLKKFAQKYIQNLTDEEKLEFMKGIDKDKIWEMAEGKAKQDVDISGEVTKKIIIADE